MPHLCKTDIVCAQGQRYGYGHRGHGYSTFRLAVATNGLGQITSPTAQKNSLQNNSQWLANVHNKETAFYSGIFGHKTALVVLQ